MRGLLATAGMHAKKLAQVGIRSSDEFAHACEGLRNFAPNSDVKDDRPDKCLPASFQ